MAYGIDTAYAIWNDNKIYYEKDRKQFLLMP